MSISFFNEETEFQLPGKNDHKKWIKDIIRQHDKSTGNINYVFCNDNYLLEINKTHLNHDYYTDIITFDLSEKEETIDADIFISVDRIKENAEKNGNLFMDELNRVMAHGILHCLHFSDKTEKEREVMRKKEDSCLSLRKFK